MTITPNDNGFRAIRHRSLRQSELFLAIVCIIGLTMFGADVPGIGWSAVESASALRWWRPLAPGASAHFDTTVVDWPVMAAEPSRRVDLGDSTAKSLTVGPHDVHPLLYHAITTPTNHIVPHVLTIRLAMSISPGLVGV